MAESSYDKLALKDPLIPQILRKWRYNTADGFIIAEVFFNEHYDKLRPLQEGDVVVDAGAHIGIFTVRASMNVGDSGKVYAFEPEHENLELLKFNTQDLKNVEIHETALWNAEGYKILHQSKGNTGGHSLFGAENRTPVYKVKTVRLDDVINERVDFIKIDVEEAEVEVLKGAEKILNKYRPFVAVEIHDGPPLVEKVVSFLSELGYERVPPTSAYCAYSFTKPS